MKYIITLILLSCTQHILAQWNPDTFVNLEVANLETADLQTATTSDGKTWIAFYHNNAGNYDMRAQLLDQLGNKLLGPDGVLVCNQTSGSATFVFNVCLDASNNLIIGFQYEVAGIPTAVITRVNTDGSLPWGAAGIQLGAGLAPYPALLTTGETVVAWNNSTPATLYMQKIDAAGTAVWASPIPVTASGGNTTRGQIVANPGGYFTMVLQKRGVGISTTLFTQRYNSNGIAQWAAPVQISTLTTSGARYYSIVVSEDTTFFGYYAASGSRFFSYVQRINPDGTIPWGTNGSAFSTYSTGSDPYQQTTNIGYSPGASVIWAVCTYSNTSQSQYGVFVQKFDKTNGTVLLDPLGKVVYPISTNFDTQAGRMGFYFTDNPLFITYDVNYKIKLNALFPSGDPFANFPVEMSSTTATLATPKGRFAFEYSPASANAVAIWYENRGSIYKAYAQSQSMAIVPVTLIDFKAIKSNKQADLFWNTATESNNKGFYIERSNDGINFKSLGFVNSKAQGGNSNGNLDYSFTDLQPLDGHNYYRLKQTNIDGKYTYSKTLNLRFGQGKDFYINNIYPSPATTVLHLSIVASVKADGIVNITDANGKIVSKHAIKLNEAGNNADINVSDLSKGVYVIKLVVEDRVITKRWVKD